MQLKTLFLSLGAAMLLTACPDPPKLDPFSPTPVATSTGLNASYDPIAVKSGSEALFFIWGNGSRNSVNHDLYGRFLGTSNSFGAQFKIDDIDLSSPYPQSKGGVLYSAAKLTNGNNFVLAYAQPTLNRIVISTRKINSTADRLDADNYENTSFWSNNPSASAFQIKTVPLAGGKFALVWTDNAAISGSIQVSARIYNSDGTASGNKITVAQYAANQPYPEMHATELNDGSFLVVWSEFDTIQGQAGKYTYAKRIGSDGSVGTAFFITGFNVDSFNSRLATTGPRVAGLSNGGFVVIQTIDGILGRIVQKNIYNSNFVETGAPALFLDTDIVYSQNGSEFELKSETTAGLAAHPDGGFAIAVPYHSSAYINGQRPPVHVINVVKHDNDGGNVNWIETDASMGDILSIDVIGASFGGNIGVIPVGLDDVLQTKYVTTYFKHHPTLGNYESSIFHSYDDPIEPEY